MHWSSHRKIKGSKKPRKLLKFGILNELGTEISIRVSLGSRTVLYSNLPNNRVGPFNRVGGRFLRN